MKHSDSIASLGAALVAAQGDIKAVGKDSVNPHFKNKYASLDSIIEATRPVLAKQGLAIVQGATAPITDETGKLVGFAVETMLIHKSGEWLVNSAILPLAKQDAQGAGGALTYGRRYGLSALLSLATEDDEDGQARPAAPALVAQAPLTRPQVEKALDMAPANGTGNTGAHAVKMPFGKQKGVALGEIDDGSLESTIEWARKTDSVKFKDLIANCEAVLAYRGAPEEIPF